MISLFAAFFEEEIDDEGLTEIRLIGVYTTIELFQRACEIHFETIRERYQNKILNWSTFSRTVCPLISKDLTVLNDRYFAKVYTVDKLPNYSMHTNHEI